MSGELVIVGDTLLDVDIEGTTERLCPDTPAPVVDVECERSRPGGAGLAALLAARSGHRVVLVSAFGDDPAAQQLHAMLGGEVEVVGLPLRGRTVRKTRVRAAGQVLVRLDDGDGQAAHEIPSERALTVLRHAGAVLVADYGRGVAGVSALRRELARVASRVPVVWDPHPRGSTPVAGLCLATPNQDEAETFAAALVAESNGFGVTVTPNGDALNGRRATDGQATIGSVDAFRAAAALRQTWGTQAVVVTLGARGAAFVGAADTAVDGVSRIPSPDDIVVPPGADTCGAGDSFAVAAAGALLAGASPRDAARAAVREATAFVAAGGASVVTVAPEPRRPAVVTDAFDLADVVRRRGGRVVAAGGCFDLLHPGHVSLLRRARELGDVLIVCVNSDESVRRLKGPGRPIMTARDRVGMLRALDCVDAAVVFDETAPLDLLERLRPDVWVKGGDYADTELPEAEVVRRHGGEVVLIPTVAGYSTTRLVSGVRG
jgi:D-beta-D-heptose 7-phosphate kinase/D-beta-D-heptose 1-phosphate adenosyltransferase